MEIYVEILWANKKGQKDGRKSLCGERSISLTTTVFTKLLLTHRHTPTLSGFGYRGTPGDVNEVSNKSFVQEHLRVGCHFLRPELSGYFSPLMDVCE